MRSLTDDKQADVNDVFNTTSRYLDDILNINNVYFDNMVSQIYPSEFQLNKANTSDTEAAFLDLHLSIPNDIVSTKMYEGCSNMNASSFITFFTYMLRQNVIHFGKEQYVAFKIAPNIKKHSLYFSSDRPLYKGHSCILKFF